MSKLIEGIIKFHKDRLLDKQKYEALEEHANIYEEILESIGFDVSIRGRQKLKEHLKMFTNILIEEKVVTVAEGEFSDLDEVDAYADIIVFSLGIILKLGFDPVEVLKEVSKEVNSREGKIIDGKFQKDTSKRAKAKWYKADYEKCRLKGEKDDRTGHTGEPN